MKQDIRHVYTTLAAGMIAISLQLIIMIVPWISMYSGPGSAITRMIKAGP